MRYLDLRHLWMLPSSTWSLPSDSGVTDPSPMSLHPAPVQTQVEVDSDSLSHWTPLGMGRQGVDLNECTPDTFTSRSTSCVSGVVRNAPRGSRKRVYEPSSLQGLCPFEASVGSPLRAEDRPTTCVPSLASMCVLSCEVKQFSVFSRSLLPQTWDIDYH